MKMLCQPSTKWKDYSHHYLLLFVSQILLFEGAKKRFSAVHDPTATEIITEITVWYAIYKVLNRVK